MLADIDAGTAGLGVAFVTTMGLITVALIQGRNARRAAASSSRIEKAVDTTGGNGGPNLASVVNELAGSMSAMRQDLAAHIENSDKLIEAGEPMRRYIEKLMAEEAS